jgi:hypothetical protein
MTSRLKGNLLQEFQVKADSAKDRKVEELLYALAEATPVDTGEAMRGWHREGNSIVNNVEHIENLNDGTSQQAPAHFIESTLLSQPGVSSSGTIVRSK